jgi:2-iminobutanoate/2-iminopropanoate deaminase
MISMKAAIQSDASPAALGAYSQAVRVGQFVFVSGQLPLSPVDNAEIPAGISAQTEQALDNVEGILATANLSMDDIVKITVYLTGLEHFGSFNAVFSRRIVGEVLPARSTVEVANLPKGAMIEIDAIAYDASGSEK